MHASNCTSCHWEEFCQSWGQNDGSDSMTSAVPTEIHMHNHTYTHPSQHTWWNHTVHYLVCSQAGHKIRSPILKRWRQKALLSQVLSSGTGCEMAHSFIFPEDPTTGAISSSSNGYVASLFCCHADLPSWPKPWKQGQGCTYWHRSKRTERTGYASSDHSLYTTEIWRQSRGKYLCSLCSFMFLQALKRSRHNIMPR